MQNKNNSKTKSRSTTQSIVLWVVLILYTNLLNANNVDIQSFKLENNYLTLRITNYGATIQELWMKDKNGIQQNLVYGFKNPIDYKTSTKYLGSCIGRHAGRLSSPLVLDGKVFELQNTNKNVQLHGGKEGFNRKIWDVISLDSNSIALSYISPSGEEGYPGTLKIRAEYRLKKSQLTIKYTATTDEMTVVNLTNHSHFNLSGSTLPLAKQFLMINADNTLETTKELMPTGRFIPVKSGPYDFKSLKKIGEQKFDTVFALNPGGTCLTYYAEDSGIQMKISTNQHGMVVFTPSTLNTICFETQNFPDAPKFEHFPPSILRPGELYEHNTVYTFNIIKSK